MSSCPNCHQPVGKDDDICENCGAVLSSLLAPATFVEASIVPQPSNLPGQSLPQTCPNCHQPLHAGDDICEQCGMVVDVQVSSVPASAAVNQAQAVTNGDSCPNCGNKRTSGVKFCGRCGYNFTATTTGPASSPAVREPAAVPASLQIGSLLNSKYKVTRTIGAGGMGAVYLADDQVLKRQVVIKALLSEDDPDLVEQSVKEREFLAAVKHANIVSIYDFITVGTQGYIVMEYVHGKTLEDLLEERREPLGVEEAIGYVLGILPAFSYLAKLGLVYCDFKPQNVMLEQLKDGTKIVKLIDLGTVIKYEPHPKDVYGTHGFYAPEAVKNPSPATDLYSICRTLAYLVTRMDLANPIFGMPSSEYYKVFRDHPGLYRLLTKGTNTRAALRFQNAEELRDQLTGVLRQIVGGRPGVPTGSNMFVAGILTTTGKLGLRGEAILDEADKAIDMLRYGDQALRAGSYSSARNFYQQAVKVNPNSVDAHLRLAEIAMDQGEYTQALAEITQVQRRSPGHWKVAWYTGRLLEAQGKYQEAADQYRELMADLPGELPPQQSLARVCARMGDTVSAVELYTRVLKADPGNTEVILGVTDALIQLQRWNEAAVILRGVNEAAARYVDAQLLLCELYLQRMVPLTPQNVQNAAEAIQGLLGRTEDPRYYLMRGDIYRAAWLMARNKQLPSNISIAGISKIEPRSLGQAAEESYSEYLRRERHPIQREAVVRRRFEVAPWHWV
ncbi:protein kinase domain-containing protein [Dictyobacter kobayashii]|uniref:non-specific serine/threonine protein kinase n=1 Tax=Dictyobacter kobayashii TaxID=2014872 RepID=A0A402ALD7_9CHLR|nr:tetratricopeptide repeat protein [Dictyobacter kobayashii]GCE20008.1 hypothetical protein KDK_38080 [Dictyobacter kobayashii]